jgi:hypothetical protein
MASLSVDSYNIYQTGRHSNLNEDSSKTTYSQKPTQLRSESDYLREIKELKQTIE